MSGRIEDRLNELKSLPEIDPGKDLEVTTLGAMAAAAAAAGAPRFSPRDLASAAAWLAFIGIGAWLVVMAVSIEQAVDAPEARAALADETLVELAAQSMRLEELLASIPPPRRVMRADTASTIVGLEDRIALIDSALDRIGAEATPPEYRQALMRDRIEVMNALVNVRYAQSTAFIF